jgi:tetratricopeptide (TPR) repeat protein
MISELFGPAALGAGITSSATFEGLKMIATLALRRRRESAWARAVVTEVGTTHPGLLKRKEADRLTKWLIQAGVSDILHHNREEVARRLLVALRDEVLATEGTGPPNRREDGGRAAGVFHAVVGEVVRQLGPEAVHVLDAGGLAGAGSSLEEAVGAELTEETRLALERERDLVRRVAISGLLNRPFLQLEGVPSPATVLRPAYGVVPFDDSAGQLHWLTEWANETAGHSVVALLGPPGSGKTRLAVEFCRVMSSEGWRTGLLARSATVDSAAFATFLEWNACRVLVIDYAEDRPDQVRDLLTRIHGSGSRTYPVRVVLTVRRSFGPGWRSAFRGSDADDILDASGELNVVDAWQYIDRGQFFTSAQAAFEGCLQIPSRHLAQPPDWVHDPALDTPLLLAASALTDFIAGGSEAFPAHRNADEVVVGLLAHEANYWTGAPVMGDGPTGTVVTARALIAAALGDSQERMSETGIARRLEYCSDFRDETAARRRQWARWLLRQYPGGRLEPDLFLEHLVVEQCADASADDPIDWAVALAPQRTILDITATLALISRVAQRTPGFATSIVRAWEAALPPLVELAHRHADDARPLLSSLAVAAEVLPLSPALERVALDLPDEPRFAGLGAALLQKTVTALKGRGVEDERVFDALVGLGVYRGLLAAPAQAAEAAMKAVDWVRRIAPGGDPGRQRSLARSLGNLGADLAEAGEAAAAIAAANEAVSLYRSLLDDTVPRSRRDLAFALHNLGGAMTMAGDHDGALAATSECVRLMRAFASTDPDQKQLSIGLTNLALCYLRCGRGHAAVGPASEGVQLLRPLARRSPDDHNAQLMKALSTLSAASERNGEDETALTSQKETVALARLLYSTDPGRWTEDLARHLRVLSRRLESCGLREAESIRAEAERLTAKSSPTESDQQHKASSE